jgi:hypothetical protein
VLGHEAETREIGFELPLGYWGVDIFIGERDHLDRGFGSQAVSLVYRYLIEDGQRIPSYLMASPSEEAGRSRP